MVVRSEQMPSRKHERTKTRKKPEGKGAGISAYFLFRVFVLSCFRDLFSSELRAIRTSALLIRTRSGVVTLRCVLDGLLLPPS